MKTSRALLLSIAITLAATAILSFLFGGRVLALFLLLPIGFLFARKKPPTENPPPHNRSPIEPK
ncbi:hypothetical protein KKH27_00040 [bacterium]|nr:hypothetical protein [bacterium]MBU1984813.1 hypothetical protein [bacterium]